jgi:hypothetical protein
MPEENPSLQIDTDWKKQAQEEKRRLAEQQKQREQQAAGQPPPVIGTTASAAASTAPGATGAAPGETRQRAAAAASGGPGARELPPASFATLVQSLVTQALFYLGDLAVRGGEPVVNLDMAKHHIDTLGVLEEKTRGNLSADEQRLLDSALYEARMRYVNTASQYIS